MRSEAAPAETPSSACRPLLAFLARIPLSLPLFPPYYPSIIFLPSRRGPRAAKTTPPLTAPPLREGFVCLAVIMGGGEGEPKRRVSGRTKDRID